MPQTVLAKENILLNQEIADMESAIRLAGDTLVKQGYVEEAYIEKMLEREQLSSTFMGNFVAIPHGTEDAKHTVINSGIVVIQAPNGVDFGKGNIAKLIIGIAGKNDEHLDILSQIAIVCSEEENIERLVQAQSADEILELFEGVN
ncbi:PTS sugar transporter subunit IIA [Bacillus horti]|uniref:Mannitol-specific phosphotransferase enzyme IIA component n=1 Tax=Caldalkalibacillus horti TaxID=77523 RepID=A0ABT9W3C6_9BACI|nr:PTS sugar transporter subunit IIA [Bacillus horti]MDQ0167751.1 PTS system mannitol-specific IIA component [Bacillus horti]